MTTDHKELCLGLRHMISTRAERAADLIEQQAARIAELEAACKTLERARATDPVCVKWYADNFDAAQSRIAELEKERDALKVDGERYRWLRNFGKDGVNLKPPCEHVYTLLYSHPVGVIPASRVITGNELDCAIDAALQAEKETK